MNRVLSASIFLLLAVVASVGGWAATARQATPVTITEATTRTLVIRERSVGRLMAKTAPRIAAEVAGRVVAVAVDVGAAVHKGDLLARIDDADHRLARQLAEADIARLQALIRARRLQVERLRKLRSQQSVDQSRLDDAEAQLGATQAQLQGAKLRLAQARRNLDRCRIVSPVDGRVTERRVSVGDYLKPGAVVFRVTDTVHLQARLPFPQALAPRFAIGQAVRLTTPFADGEAIEGRVTAIDPEIDAASLAIHLLVDIDDPGRWKPGASIAASVVVAEHRDAVVVAEGVVVRRPAGLVVYRIDGDRAREQRVETGVVDRGEVEILSGLAPGDRVALDGAAYLNDGARVVIDQSGSKPE